MPPRKGAMKQAIVAAAHKMQSLGLSPGRSGNISVRWKQGQAPPRRHADYRVRHPASGFRRGNRYCLCGWRGQVGGRRKGAVERMALPSGGLRSPARCGRGGALPFALRHGAGLRASADPLVPLHGCQGRRRRTSPSPLTRPTARPSLPPTLPPHSPRATPACSPITARSPSARALEDAIELAEEVEVLAAQYVTARLLGEPVLLPADEMAHVAEKFKTYGKAANPPKPSRAKPKSAAKPRKR